MEWQSTFIVYRVGGSGQLAEVFHSSETKKAKYWLSYIAQIGDVLCKTPIHPAHSKRSTSVEYYSHKVSSGKALSDEAVWRSLAAAQGWKEIFPDKPDSPSALKAESKA